MAYPRNSDDDPSELEGMESGGTATPGATLENLSIFAERYIELDKELKEIDDYAKKLEEEQATIEETNIPGIMQALKMAEFSMKDGFKLKIEPKFQGSIVMKDEAKATQQLAWIDSVEGGDIVKFTITCDFNKGHEGEAQELIKLLKQLGIMYKAKRTVHASTLASFVKAKLTAGEEVPLDDLNWRYFDKASVKKKGFKLRKRRKRSEDWGGDDEDEG
jgi:hypothetical protein